MNTRRQLLRLSIVRKQFLSLCSIDSIQNNIRIMFSSSFVFMFSSSFVFMFSSSFVFMFSRSLCPLLLPLYSVIMTLYSVIMTFSHRTYRFDLIRFFGV
jgi:hypothetical protein